MINMAAVQLMLLCSLCRRRNAAVEHFACIGVKVKTELPVNIAGCADACKNGGRIY